jgi:hypothetical protein
MSLEESSVLGSYYAKITMDSPSNLQPRAPEHVSPGTNTATPPAKRIMRSPPANPYSRDDNKVSASMF